MPNYSRYLSGAAGGAATGFTFGGPLGAGIGAVAGLGLSLFDSDPYEEQEAIRKERQKELLAKIEGYRTKTLTRGAKEIGTMTSEQSASARQAASRRALSLGRSADAEDFIIPAEGQVKNYGANAMRKFITDTNDQYDRNVMSVEMEGLNAPYPPQYPGLGETIGELGSMASNFMLDQQYVNAMKTPARAPQPLAPGTGTTLGLSEQQRMQEELRRLARVQKSTYGV